MFRKQEAGVQTIVLEALLIFNSLFRVKTIVLGTRPPGGMWNALQEEIVNAIVL
jgi:hypothetical protein